jgi:hypothetical protein
MTKRIEQSYKHGPFDPRYPRLSKVEPAPRRHGPRADPGPLEWYAYLARYFPGRRGNDFEALSAYELDSRPRNTSPPEAGLPSAAVSVWEWEGGRSDEGRRDAVSPAVARR